MNILLMFIIAISSGILNMDFGARSAALGGSNTSFLSLSPLLRNHQVLLAQAGYSREIAGWKDTYLRVLFPLRNVKVGFSFIYSSSGSIEEWNEDDVKTGEFKTSELRADVFFLFHFKKFFGFLSAGWYRNDLKIETGKGLVCDIASGYKLERASVVVSLRNVSNGIKYNSATISPDIEGVIKILFHPWKTWLFTAGMKYRENFYPSFGIEYSIDSLLFFRLGYYHDVTVSRYKRLRAGIGVNLENYSVNYALVPRGELGYSHLVTLFYTAPFKLKIPGKRKTESLLVLRIRDRKYRYPLSAQVDVLYGENKKITLKSDPQNGEVHIRKSGSLTIRIKKEGYYPCSLSVYLKEGETIKKTILLDRIQESFVYGFVYEKGTIHPISGVRIYYEGPQSGDVITSANGSYKITLERPGEYVLKVTKFGFSRDSTTIIVDPGRKYSKNFYLEKSFKEVKLEMIHFETAMADLKPEAYPILNRIGKFLQEYPEVKIRVSGHTDPREIHTSRFASNWELSRARAESVKEYLIKKFKISPGRIEIAYYADTRPIAPNDTEDGMAKNRRVEFEIIRR